MLLYVNNFFVKLFDVLSYKKHFLLRAKLFKWTNLSNFYPDRLPPK